MQCSPGCSQQSYYFHSAHEKTDMEKLNALPEATGKEVATGAAVTSRQHWEVVSDTKGRLDESWTESMTVKRMVTSVCREEVE